MARAENGREVFPLMMAVVNFTDFNKAQEVAQHFREPDPNQSARPYERSIGKLTSMARTDFVPILCASFF